VTQSITDLRGLTGSPIASPTFIVHRETPTITAAAAEPDNRAMHQRCDAWQRMQYVAKASAAATQANRPSRHGPDEPAELLLINNPHISSTLHAAWRP